MNKASKIYRKAAELVITGHDKWMGTSFSCIAIEAATDYDTVGKWTGEYAELFSPPPRIDPHRINAWGNLWGNTPQEQQDCRVLALLFMSEIAKGETK